MSGLTTKAIKCFKDAIASPYQHTLNHSFTLAGIGLHTGANTSVTIYPAPPHQGRYCVWMEHPNVPVAAHLSFVHQTQFCTTLRQRDITIATVEHLLAALVGMGIDNARIELQGPEIPVLDGSAQMWTTAILDTGYQLQSERRLVPTLHYPVLEQKGEAFVMAMPEPQLSFSCGIDFPEPAIGEQWHRCSPQDFLFDIAPARTFGRAEDVESLRTMGFIKGGSLDNALVCRQDEWLNPPLRFANEPVRHKLLDLIGDLSLLGYLPSAHYVAYKASHSLHIRFAKRLQQVLSD
ncbi:UDP-3-O-acyl-N-acetylglucosamine deacetylase [Acaryochloris sp. IP29b_bin.137]|uniref:UDP-3-O-acyl-N-acetylglucosamine deacetylase n=1 Tax=Acaryochloris sp. IP29b_bin.137 TaxID=2969217 RepID=UPI002626AAF7|nr:UDP-3-O-acyl-N-acetylglucosamine deacetylase [Acaryochloris sp. IP29b_bin.137]